MEGSPSATTAWAGHRLHVVTRHPPRAHAAAEPIVLDLACCHRICSSRRSPILHWRRRICSPRAQRLCSRTCSRLPPPSLTSPPDLLASSRHCLVPYRHHSTADLAAVGCALRARAVAALSLSLCDRVRAGAAEIFLSFFTFFTQQASL